MTNSRYRANVATLFDVCCQVGAGGDEIIILQTYPEDFQDESILRSIKQFTFPSGVDNSDENDAVQLFTFVLTDAQSCYTFGYCRYTPRNNTCICILSGLPYTNLFYKFLNHISNVINNGSQEEFDAILTNAYHIDIPNCGETLTLNACPQKWHFNEIISDVNKLPTLREDKFMLEFYNGMTEKQMIFLYASLLKERRIIFTSQKLSQLSSCVFASSRLLYPFYWQNLFIPILPSDLTDMLMAPMPFIIGVPKKTFQNLRRTELGELVIVDLDEKTFESAHHDALPPDALAFLKNQLKNAAEMFLSDGLARSFLRTNVLIFGKYRLGLIKAGSTSVLLNFSKLCRFPENLSTVTWDRHKFVREQRPSLQPFLDTLMGKDGVQYFERFIEEKLKAINSGQPIKDEFEQEITYMDRNTDWKSLQSNQAEILQQAVASVRENASDVFGALKDRVQSISIKDKFGKFTPKEVRRNKMKSHKKKQLQPLSVDNTIFDFNNPLAKRDEEKDDIEEAVAATSETGSIESSEDLIDLSDSPTKPGDLNSTRSLPSAPDRPPQIHATASANMLLEHLNRPLPVPPPRQASSSGNLGFNPFEIQPQCSSGLVWNSETLRGQSASTPGMFSSYGPTPSVTPQIPMSPRTVSLAPRLNITHPPAVPNRPTMVTTQNLNKKTSPNNWEKFED